MPLWKDDTEMFRLIETRLYTPVFGDILDGMGSAIVPRREHFQGARGVGGGGRAPARA